MSNLNVHQHKLVVKAGMTVDDIKSSKDATSMQKKYASAFDTDKNGFSQQEADLFNATTFSEKGDGTVTFWTRQKDGTKKGTKFDSKDNNIQFKSEEEVKPYIKQVKVKKAAKEESVSFFDEKWSGNLIAKLTGDNVVTDWLQDKDKVCTDGKDDGKIGFWEGTKSLAKGIIGGIPKMIINHPVTTAVTVAAGAAAVALTGGAILPVLGAAGVVMGAGMAGYSGYKAATAKTDGEAKQALETCGTGITTAALSALSAGKTLEKAAEAGVKSAQVSEDAGIIDKTVQMFKAIPECLTKSKEWARFKLDIPVTKICNDKGHVIEKSYGEDIYRKYEGKGYKHSSELLYEKLPNGTTKKYQTGYCEPHILEEKFANGAYKKYDRYHNGRLLEETTTDGTVRRYSEYSSNELLEETYDNGGYKRFDSKGNVTEELVVTSDKKSLYRNGKLKEETFTDGGYKKFDSNGNVTSELKIKGDTKSYYKNGKLVKESFSNGGYREYDASGTNVTEELVITNDKKVLYRDGNIKSEHLADGTYREYSTNNPERIITEELPDGTRTDRYIKYYGQEGDFTKTTLKDGSYKVVDSKTGKIIEELIVKNGNRSLYKNGKLVVEQFANGGYKKYRYDFLGNKKVAAELVIKNGQKTLYKNGEIVAIKTQCGETKHFVKGIEVARECSYTYQPEDQYGHYHGSEVTVYEYYDKKDILIERTHEPINFGL